MPLPNSPDNVKDPSDVSEQTSSVDDPQLPSPETCVICLDRIIEQATALPCHHDQFDFLCLGTWIQEQRVCPLCKSEITAIQYRYGNGGATPRIWTLPPPDAKDRSRTVESQDVNADPGRRHEWRYSTDQSHGTRRHQPYNGAIHRQNRRRRPVSQPISMERDPDANLDFRRHVYQNKLYSLHVGTNRISQYRNITPRSFQTNTRLIARAKVFLRRELAVFDFLNPASSSSATPNDTGRRRASNAEFLLEYLLSILKTIDLKASTGQAEDLVAEFLGRHNARLFLHELEAWLRSPYEKLLDWDRHVQYDTGRSRQVTS